MAETEIEILARIICQKDAQIERLRAAIKSAIEGCRYAGIYALADELEAVLEQPSPERTEEKPE